MSAIKKKIKDLTLEECDKICKKYELCYGCPLEETIKCIYYNEEALEEEVEVEENGNEED